MATKLTTVLIIGNSLKHSQALELGQSAQEGKVRFVLSGIIPRIPTQFYQMPSTIDTEAQLVNEMEAKLTTLGRLLGIPKSDRYIIKEREQSLQSLAKDIGAHLIINDMPDDIYTYCYSLITGKKPPRKTWDVPSIRSKEYLDIINSSPVKKSSQETEENEMEEDYHMLENGFEDNDHFLSLGGLFNWLSEKCPEQPKQITPVRKKSSPRLTRDGYSIH